jgi:hypothetical protein
VQQSITVAALRVSATVTTITFQQTANPVPSMAAVHSMDRYMIALAVAMMLDIKTIRH